MHLWEKKFLSVSVNSIQTFQNLYYSAHFFIICHDLDAVRVSWGAGEYAFHHTFCDLTCALMVFLNESHVHAGLDVFAFRFHPIKVGKAPSFQAKLHKKRKTFQPSVLNI